MRLKQRLMLIGLLIPLFLSGHCAALPLIGISPYIGVNVDRRHMNFSSGLGDNLFAHDYPQAGIYVGAKLFDYFGAELGYQITHNKQRSTALAPGEVSAGIAVPSRFGTLHYVSKAQFEGTYINVLGFMPICDLFCWQLELMGSVGLTSLKAYLVRHFVAANQTPIDPPLTMTFTDRKQLLRLGLGLQSILLGHFGIRAMVNWENTSKLNLFFNNINNRPQIKPKDSLIFSISALILF